MLDLGNKIFIFHCTVVQRKYILLCTVCTDRVCVHLSL